MISTGTSFSSVLLFGFWYPLYFLVVIDFFHVMICTIFFNLVIPLYILSFTLCDGSDTYDRYPIGFAILSIPTDAFLNFNIPFTLFHYDALIEWSTVKDSFPCPYSLLRYHRSVDLGLGLNKIINSNYIIELLSIFNLDYWYMLQARKKECQTHIIL
jgi:hypothetical protein